jgi:hypothetical protein
LKLRILAGDKREGREGEGRGGKRNIWIKDESSAKSIYIDKAIAEKKN